MSSKLIKLFSNILLPRNLPRVSIIKGTHLRFMSTMDVAKVNDDDRDKLSDKRHTRYRKRQWDDHNKKENEGSDPKKLNEGDAAEKSDKPFERIKKKKMALLLGYCGVDYYGMQRNPGVRTIEEDLLTALHNCKYITEEDFKNQQNAQFQRSSRTDKGVSAARQVVSLKLPLEVDIEEINKRLPECIRVFGVKRVTNKFNSKGKCNARTYSYTLPTYTFDPSVDYNSIEEKKKYRISEEKLEEVNKVLSVYKGTRSYHNFTEKKYHTDPSSSRFMMSFAVEKVFVDSDMEFAELLVKGQSFMLHQIRKMVGLAVSIVRGQAPEGIIEKVFGKEKVMIPTAPGLGLMLDMVHYERYAARYKNSHDSLTWEECDGIVEKFKREHIHPIVVKGEIENNSIGLWLEKISTHSFEPNEDNQEKVDEEVKGGDDDDDDGEEKDDDEGKEDDESKIDDEIKKEKNKIENESKDVDKTKIDDSETAQSNDVKLL